MFSWLGYEFFYLMNSVKIKSVVLCNAKANKFLLCCECVVLATMGR